MQRGFPLELLALAGCPVDRGPLRPVSRTDGAFIDRASARCDVCARTFLIHDGILSLLDPSDLHPESAREMCARDRKNDELLARTRAGWSSRFSDELELRPTLDALGSVADRVVCELGCGSGRYTHHLASTGAAIMALDVSRSGLLVLKRDLEPTARVGLVQADVTANYAVPSSFDRVLSTLHSNLPGSTYRTASLLQMAEAMKADGRAVISMHHYAVREAARFLPTSGRYEDSGIYREFMTTGGSRAEAGPFFGRIRHQYIAVSVPGLRSLAASRAAARIPLVRSGLGRIMLAIVEQPLRRPTTGSGARDGADRVEMPGANVSRGMPA